jgi:hypothetical protein
MILLDAINWLMTAIIWFFTPVFRLFGLYALAAGGVVVVIFLAVTALRGNGKRRRTKPT